MLLRLATRGQSNTDERHTHTHTKKSFPSETVSCSNRFCKGLRRRAVSIAKLSVYMHFSTICVQRKILKHHKTPTRIPFALLVKCRNFTIIKSIIKKKLDSLVTKKTSSVLNELKIIFEGTKGQRSLEPVDIFNRCRETNPHGPLLCIKYIQTILTREFII